MTWGTPADRGWYILLDCHYTTIWCNVYILQLTTELHVSTLQGHHQAYNIMVLTKALTVILPMGSHGLQFQCTLKYSIKCRCDAWESVRVKQTPVQDRHDGEPDTVPKTHHQQLGNRNPPADNKIQKQQPWQTAHCTAQFWLYTVHRRIHRTYDRDMTLPNDWNYTTTGTTTPTPQSQECKCNKRLIRTHAQLDDDQQHIRKVKDDQLTVSKHSYYMNQTNPTTLSLEHYITSRVCNYTVPWPPNPISPHSEHPHTRKQLIHRCSTTPTYATNTLNHRCVIHHNDILYYLITYCILMYIETINHGIP